MVYSLGKYLSSVNSAPDTVKLTRGFSFTNKFFSSELKNTGQSEYCLSIKDACKETVTSGFISSSILIKWFMFCS